MKAVIAALFLSILAAPVLALDASPFAAIGASPMTIQTPSVDEFGRRSGACVKHGFKAIGREGSTCGGV
jgi:hypothetical protein